MKFKILLFMLLASVAQTTFSDVKFNEVFRNSMGYLELVNTGSSSVDLSTYSVTTYQMGFVEDASDIVIPGSEASCPLNGVLDSGEYLVVTLGRACDTAIGGDVCVQCDELEITLPEDPNIYAGFSLSEGTTVLETGAYPSVKGAPYGSDECHVPGYWFCSVPAYAHLSFCQVTCGWQSTVYVPLIFQSWSATLEGDPTSEWEPLDPTPGQPN